MILLFYHNEILSRSLRLKLLFLISMNLHGQNQTFIYENRGENDETEALSNNFKNRNAGR